MSVRAPAANRGAVNVWKAVNVPMPKHTTPRHTHRSKPAAPRRCCHSSVLEFGPVPTSPVLSVHVIISTPSVYQPGLIEGLRGSRGTLSEERGVRSGAPAQHTLPHTGSPRLRPTRRSDRASVSDAASSQQAYRYPSHCPTHVWLFICTRIALESDRIAQRALTVARARYRRGRRRATWQHLRPTARSRCKTREPSPGWAHSSALAWPTSAE